MPLVELQKLLNDLVTDSPHMARAKNTSPQVTTKSQLIKKRPFDNPDAEGSKRHQRGEGSGRGRGRGKCGGKGRTFQTMAEWISAPSLEL
jgi:hypothetical protein